MARRRYPQPDYSTLSVAELSKLKAYAEGRMSAQLPGSETQRYRQMLAAVNELLPVNVED